MASILQGALRSADIGGAWAVAGVLQEGPLLISLIKVIEGSWFLEVGD